MKTAPPTVTVDEGRIYYFLYQLRNKPLSICQRDAYRTIKKLFKQFMEGSHKLVGIKLDPFLFQQFRSMEAIIHNSKGEFAKMVCDASIRTQPAEEPPPEKRNGKKHPYGYWKELAPEILKKYKSGIKVDMLKEEYRTHKSMIYYCLNVAKSDNVAVL